MIYRFEAFILDTGRRELRNGEALCAIEPQVFDLLEYLVRNRERVVSRDEIYKAIWRDRIVSDSVLTTRINAARSAIGDNGAGQRLIRTLRTKGVRFVGAVQEQKSAPGRPTDEAPDGSRRGLLIQERPTIAVLPFANLDGDPRQERIADGLTEELIVALSKVGWLSVISRNSSFAYKNRQMTTAQIARKLGVRYVIEGSLRQAAGRVRVTAQLIDGLADHQLWTERYDREVTKIFAVQDDITEKVMAAIEPQLYFAEEIRTRGTSVGNLNAWECMVRALSLMNSRSKATVDAARRLLQRAVELDPGSAQAHSLLSLATTLGVHMGWSKRQTGVPVGLATARNAMLLNTDEPWAHAALGYAMIWRQPAEALPHLHRALSLNPNFAVGHYLLALASTYAGDCEKVFMHADVAERLAPRDLLARGYAGAHNNVRATAAFAIGQHSQGVDFARKAIADSPRAPTAYRALVINLALGDRVAEARKTLPLLKRVAPEVSQEWIRESAVWAGAGEMKKYVEAFTLSGLE